jgi:hypothetical protein
MAKIARIGASNLLSVGFILGLLTGVLMKAASEQDDEFSRTRLSGTPEADRLASLSDAELIEESSK